MTYALLLLLFQVWLLWGLYVLVMGLYRAHLQKRLTWAGYILAAPFLLGGWLLDVVTNLTLANVVFWEFPQELLVTDRLQRHIRHGKGWRRELSAWICASILDMFDPTDRHC